METNFVSAAPKDTVTLRQVEATIQRRWGAAEEKCVLHHLCVQTPTGMEQLRMLKQEESTTPGTGLQQDTHS